MPRAEVIEAGVLEEAADDGDDADVVGQAGDAGPEAAEAADDEGDLHAGLGGLVELAGDLEVFEGVHLGDDPAAGAGSGERDLTVDELHERVAHGEGGDEDVAVLALEGAAGEEVEEVGR